MGLFDEFINAQIGGMGALFGIHRTKEFNVINNHNFAPTIREHKLTIVLQGLVRPNYVSGSIQGATKSFWTHAIIMGNYEMAKLLRVRYPSLCNRKQNPIPVTICDLEFVEATYPKCRIGTLYEYMDSDIQQIAFCFNLINTNRVMQILKYAYSRNGMNYDISEILSDVLPSFRIHHNNRLHCCSSLVATSCNFGGMAVVGPSVAPYQATPGNIYEKTYPKKDIIIAKWNFI